MKHAIIVELNERSSGRNPTFLLSPESYATLRAGLAGPSQPDRDASSFWLGCVILTNVGGVPGFPEQILVDREGVCLVDATGERSRQTGPGLYKWLLDLADAAGFKDRTHALRL
jgi:hypothetical protein